MEPASEPTSLPSPSVGPPIKPGKVEAISIMVMAGGIWALIVGLSFGIWGVLLGLGTCGIGCVVVLPAIYSLVLGVIAIVQGAKLLGPNAYLEPPPRTIAILQIVNIVACDVVNLILGILILVFLEEPEVRSYYRGTGQPSA